MVLATCVLGCSEPSPPIEVTDLLVYSPLPGTGMTAAYLTVANNTDSAVELVRVTSPQFGRVELHETTITDGVARMQPVASVPVAPHSVAELQPGGLHLMLMLPETEWAPGDPVALELHYSDLSSIVITGSFTSRYDSDKQGQ